MALVFFQGLQQPIIEAADFHHRQERFTVPEKIAFHPLKEFLNLLQLRRYLPRLHDVTQLIPQGDRELAGMLVDSKVQRGQGSPA